MCKFYQINKVWLGFRHVYSWGYENFMGVMLVTMVTWVNFTHSLSAILSKNTVSANIKHTSIKHQIADQSTTVVKGCMYIC